MAVEAIVSFFGASARFHHVGLAVPDAAAGMPGIEMTADPIQRVRVAFVGAPGCVIELIEPLGPDSPVSNSIGKGIKLVHLCFEVDDIAASLHEAATSGFKIIQPPVSAVAFDGRDIAWVWHPFWGVFELLEREGAAGSS